MISHIIAFALGMFLGAYLASKPFRARVNKIAKNLFAWWKRHAEGENKKSKKGAK